LDINHQGGAVDLELRRFLFPAVHLCIIPVCIIGLLYGEAVAQNNAPARKQVLTEQLDSIDLEKQLRKRRGESLEDLEKSAEILKDSIAALKREMPPAAQGLDQAEDSGEKSAGSTVNASDRFQQFQKFLPKTFFDWMVDIVGFIAVISGIVLLFGIFGLLSKGFKKKRKAAPLHKPLHEVFPRSYAADAYDRIPKVPGGRTEENNEALASLRKRIEDVPPPKVKEPEDDGVLATVDDSAEGNDGFPGRTAGPEEQKKKVILAARQGLDVSEISRRFHLSADEVSLILRMARRDNAQ
jgi:hypothetical protein